MSRPFRFLPPTLHGAPVLRPELQRTLSGRFDRRVTAITAGAGFGKTTALLQAFEENRLLPRGSDHWLACDVADSDAHHLARALGDVFDLDVDERPERLVDDLVEVTGAAAPTEVCLVLDDVHLVERDSTGAALLARLVTDLPGNAHLVFVGRDDPPVPLSRLEATGAARRVDDEDLRLTAEQVDTMAVSRGLDAAVRAELGRLAGWPALVELSMRRGRPAAFVREEVLEWLDADQLELLRALVAVGEADAELLDALTGIDAVDRLAAIPLVQRHGDRFAAHDLWHEMLAADQDELDEIRSRAVDHLEQAGRHRDVVELFLSGDDGRDDPRLATALRDALIARDPPPSTVLRRWVDRLGDDRLEDASAVLLRAMVLRLDDPGSEACRTALTAAADAFRAAGDAAAEVASLGALAYCHHVRRDVAGLVSTFARLEELAANGLAGALPYQRLARAIVATASGDPITARAETTELLAAELPREIRAVTLWLLASALNNLGERSVDVAAECASLAVPLPGLAMAQYAGMWRAGDIERLRATPIDASTGGRDAFVAAVWRSVVALGTGDVDAARSALARAESAGGHGTDWQAQVTVGIPRALLAAEDGDDATARGILDELLTLAPVDGPARGFYVIALAVLYPLSPELRGHFDTWTDLGPLYRRDLRLNQALVAAIELDDLDGLDALSVPERVGEFLPALGPTRCAELLAAMWTVGHPDAADLVAEFVDLLGEAARDRFRRAVRRYDGVDGPGSAAIASGARAIVESMPVAPADPVLLRLLGGTDLSIGGRLVESADWRRERVRALIAFLVLNPDTTREHVIAALWPEADPDAGRRNLRTTLNMTQAVLEPGRVGGDAPYFIRSSGQRLRLISDDRIEVDVERFEHAISNAERLEADGTSSMAIEPYLQAVEWYRGDLLPDSYDDWIVFARDRLRARFVGAAVRACELLIVTGRADEAIEVAIRALTVEPWAEPAHRTLVAAHLERGDLAAARRAMATCRDVLADLGGPTQAPTLLLERRLGER